MSTAAFGDRLADQALRLTNGVPRLTEKATSEVYLVAGLPNQLPVDGDA